MMTHHLNSRKSMDTNPKAKSTTLITLSNHIKDKVHCKHPRKSVQRHQHRQIGSLLCKWWVKDWPIRKYCQLHNSNSTSQMCAHQRVSNLWEEDSESLQVIISRMEQLLRNLSLLKYELLNYKHNKVEIQWRILITFEARLITTWNALSLIIGSL